MHSFSFSNRYLWSMTAMLTLLLLALLMGAGVEAQAGLIQPGDFQWIETYSGNPTPTPWLGRFGFSSAVTSQGTLMIMGGLTRADSSNNGVSLLYNDVQSSSNGGLTWLPPFNASFSPRFLHSSTLTVSGTLLLIGGFSLSAPPQQLIGLLDTWYSVDGITWSAGSQMPWPRGRGAHSVVADSLSLNLYVSGGLIIPRQTLNDVWKTPDGGLTWQIATLNAPFMPRAFHSSVVRLGTLFVLGGASYTTGIGYQPLLDAWTSVDQGTTWSQLDTALPFASTPRFLYTGFCYNNDDIFLIGGVSINPLFQSQNPYSAVLNYTSSVVGGLNATQPYNSTVYSDVWYTSDAGLTWIQGSPSAVFGARFGAGVVAIGQDLTVIAGLDPNASPLNDVWYTVLPMDGSSSDGTVLAAIMGTVSGIFLIFIVVLRRLQDQLVDGKVIVSGLTEKELLTSQQPQPA